MDKYIEQDEHLAKIYSGFPDYIKQIIIDSNWENEIRKIVEKKKLRIDQGAALEREVVYIMLGVDGVENFEENLKKEANINRKMAEEISGAVSLQIFEPIMEKLMSETEENEQPDFEKNEIHHELPEKKVAEPAPQINEAKNVQNNNQNVQKENSNIKPVIQKEEEKHVPEINTSNSAPEKRGGDANDQNEVMSSNFAKPNSQSPKIIDHYLEPID